MSRGTPIIDRPLARIAEALRDGRVTAEALVATAVERHEAVGDRLGAYQSWDSERALAQARGVDALLRSGRPLPPLAGMPVSVKDLFGVRGRPTWAGTSRRLPARWESEGFLIGRLRRQRAVVTGKTRMVELAYGGLGNNRHWGTPVNPWDATVHRVPGGSSSGAGVSLWEGSAVVAFGTDTACSLRAPASATGTVAHKPTHGRWPADGIVPLARSLDVVGAVTRSVEDAAYVFAAVDPRHGEPEEFLRHVDDGDLDGVRVGIVASSLWDACVDDVRASVETALFELEARGASLVDVDLPEFDAACELYWTGLLAGPECAAFVAAELPGWIEHLDPVVGERLRAAARVPAGETRDARAHRESLVGAVRERWPAVDVLATPTLTLTPPTLAEIERLDDYRRLNREVSRATNPVNVLNLCSISLPCGVDAARMPVGLQLVAPRDADERLLSIALAAERVLGTARERIGVAPLGAVAAPGRRVRPGGPRTRPAPARHSPEGAG